ncbi:MAG: pantothenate kinase, partial [Candidatus Omnitrophota bacterium]
AKNTRASILSGVVYGFASMVDGLAEKIKKELRADARVIITGADAQLIAKYCKTTAKVDENLTLKGLTLLLTARFI